MNEVEYDNKMREIYITQFGEDKTKPVTHGFSQYDWQLSIEAIYIKNNHKEGLLGSADFENIIKLALSRGIK